MDGNSLEMLRQWIDEDDSPNAVRTYMLRLTQAPRNQLRHIFETSSGSRYFVGHDGSCLRFRRGSESHALSQTVASIVVFVESDFAKGLLAQNRRTIYELIEGGTPIGTCETEKVPIEYGMFLHDEVDTHDGIARVPRPSFYHIGHPISYIWDGKVAPKNDWFPTDADLSMS